MHNPELTVPLLAQALPVMRRLLGNDHKTTMNVNVISALGTAQNRLGNLDAAQALKQEVLDYYRRVNGNDHNHTLNGLNNLACKRPRTWKTTTRQYLVLC